MTARPSTELARWLVDRLVAHRVREVVIAPGSRSAPLAFAVSAHPDLRLHTRIDERTAAFLALGMAKSSRAPVAVVTTSGTAAANLHPAVLEASHAGVQLVAITADRPASLRGTGANQTTDQVRLFGDAALFAEVANTGDGFHLAFDGPTHLNVRFTEPLVPGNEQVRAGEVQVRAGEVQVRAGKVQVRRGVAAGEKQTVVVAGDSAGPEARRAATDGGWPLFAEPSSGARTGPNALRTYRLLLDTDAANEIERVVVFGHPTLSRPVGQLLARSDVEVISVRPGGRWPTRPFPVAVECDDVVVDGVKDEAWLETWCEADCELAGQVDAYIASRGVLTPYDIAAEVAAALPPEGLLYVGASNPIRDLDIMTAPYPVGGRRLILANRGLAGIDGTLSSAIGATLARPHTTRAFAYVGDVTFLHDFTALVQSPAEQRPDLTIVVANDDGGSIFATLEQGAPEYAADFERLFATPHHANLEQLCASVGVPHWRVTTRSELAQALASPNGGIEVIEARIGRADRRIWDQTLRSLPTSKRS